MTVSSGADTPPDALRADQTGPQAAAPPVPALRAPQPPPDHARARAPRRGWLWGLGGILAMALAALGYLQPWTPAPIAVTTETAMPAPVTRVLAVNGRIAALHTVDLRPMISGTLLLVAVTQGQQVAAGQALLRFDTATQDAVLRQAVAALDSALVAQEQADATYARSLALRANVSAAAAAADRRAAQSALQEVARLAALVDQAQLQLARHTLRAPIAGTVVVLDAEPGQTADATTILMTLADLETLIVETDVDEAYGSQIATGQAAVLRLSGEAETRTGQVQRIAGRVDAATGGLAVRIGFDAPVSAPLGLTVTANIVVDQRTAALSVPRTALLTDGDGMAVLLAQDGVARRRPVTVIDWPAARLIVTGGLAPGDVVIVDATGLADGQAIRPDAP